MTPGPSPEPPGVEFESGEDRGVIATPVLRLAFHRDGDRWSHRLEVDAPLGAACLARSIGDHPEAGDHPSLAVPVYQHLHFQRGAGCVQALLVGQSGERHDSASFTVRLEGEGAIVEVDVARRSRVPGPSPYCPYLVGAPPGFLDEADEGRVAWDLREPAPGRLVFEAVPSAGTAALISLAESGRLATQVQAEAPDDPGGATRRLVYRWLWIPTGDRTPR